MRNPLAPLVALFLGILALGSATAASGVTTLNPGQADSVATFNLKQGDVVEYAWSTGLSIEFRIERAGTVVFSTSTLAGQGSFTAPQDGQYEFWFDNQGSNMSIVSWNIEQRANPLPLLIAAGVVAVVGIVLGLFLWMRMRKKAPAMPTPPPPPPSP